MGLAICGQHLEGGRKSFEGDDPADLPSVLRDLDRQFGDPLPRPMDKTGSLAWQKDQRAGRDDFSLQADTGAGIPKEDLRARSQRKWGDQDNEDFGVCVRAADHQSGEIEIGSLQVGRVHN